MTKTLFPCDCTTTANSHEIAKYDNSFEPIAVGNGFE